MINMSLCSFNSLDLSGKAFHKECFWKFLTILPLVHVWGQTEVGQKAWLIDPALIHLKGVLTGWGFDSVQASQVVPHQIRSSMSIWTLLWCTTLRSRWNRKGPSSNCSMKMKLSWYAEALGDLQFIGSLQPGTLFPQELVNQLVWVAKQK